jgi:PD-(D/E)XK endonuclease
MEIGSIERKLLVEAASLSDSWNSLGRNLGLGEKMSNTQRAHLRVRLINDRVDFSHFKHGRSRHIPKPALSRALQSSRSWEDVARAVGLTSYSSVAHLKTLASRYGLKADHLDVRTQGKAESLHLLIPATAGSTNSGQTGAHYACAWFSSRGLPVMLASEGLAYDLIVDVSGRPIRVQVKMNRGGGASARITKSTYVKDQPAGQGRNVKRAYAVDEVDYFFIIASAAAYLIPSHRVAGRTQVPFDDLLEYEVNPRLGLDFI